MTLHRPQAQESAPDILDNQDGHWWKFAQYTIEAQPRPRQGGSFAAATLPGRHAPSIQPAPDSELRRYDPWEPYRHTQGKRRTVAPPYRAFLELARNLSFVPRPNSPSFVPTQESEAAILGWCQEFGLLGILPARADAITLEPTWMLRSEFYKDPSVPGFCPSYRRWVRRSGIWRSAGGAVDIVDPPLTEDEATAERLWKSVPTKPRKSGFAADDLEFLWPKPGAAIWRWENGDWEEQPLLKSVYRYFPAVPFLMSEKWDYPRPCSEEFWYAYGEPVADFARWTIKFKEAVEIVSQFEPFKGTDQEKRRKHYIRTDRALYFLEGLAEAIGRPRRFEAGTRQLTHDIVAPSLLSAFAEMVLADFEIGRRAAQCGTCSRFFVSDEPRAQYCSVRCRNTMQRRRQRQKSEAW